MVFFFYEYGDPRDLPVRPHSVLTRRSSDRAEGDLLDYDYQGVRVARAIIENSRKVFLVADHTKFGRNAVVRLGHLGEVDALFTDRPPPAKMQEMAAANGCMVEVAAP